MTWLEDYEMAMTIQNASEMIMACYMPLMMKDVARTWIQGLPANSIHSWRDMRRVFVKNFEGTYRRPATDKDIENCVQRPREMTRKYLTRWAKLVNSATDVSEETACQEFICNCRYNVLQDKLKRKKPKRVADLVAIATIYAKSDCTKDESDEE
jgi:hypothetical protein